jgi:hypothetical protein
MPTFPGSDLVTGSGTVLLMPDGSNITWNQVSSYSLSGATITFVPNPPVPYVAPTDEYAGLVMKALQAIPANAASFYVVSQLIPKVTALIISPDNGVAAGGTTVTIKGVGFIDGCTVNWNGSLVAVTFVDAKTITIETPAATVGDVTIPIVRNPDGFDSYALNAFKYT